MPTENGQAQANENEEARTGHGPHSDHESPSVWQDISWISVVFGWLAALGAGVLLGGITSGLVALSLGDGGSRAAEGIPERSGLVITVFLAFVVGGFVAGRMAGRYGALHGILVPFLSLVATVVLALVGLVIGASLMGNLSGVTLPAIPQDARQGLDALVSVTGVIVLLLVPFAGGLVGGVGGMRTGEKQP